ncbi:MAG: phosphoribosylglycinamide formyltransferase [Deltaproteobacteria bacterium]|nr:phosphoribosylglycinamide formyltransferase [Deltaproteobacteria bacterium]
MIDESRNGHPLLPDDWDVRRADLSDPLRLAVLASGGGTNLEAILNACDKRRIHATVVAVVANRPGAGALDRARKHGIPAILVDHRRYRNRREHETAMLLALAGYRPQLAVLAGYMRLVTDFFLAAFTDPSIRIPAVINIHPADTRAYQGIHGYEFALGLLPEHPDRLSETFITVHCVDQGMDTGPILAQRRVEVRPDDTLETLKKRGLAIEHALYPTVIDQLAAGRISLAGSKQE